ncbi:MAG: PRC-barrel domain-containing protein [Beijerinckiaceae bacterium]
MQRAHPDHNLISSERVRDTAVFSTSGEQIGTIDHMMIEKIGGKVSYAVMSFGGFLGIGHNHYPIPWSALKYDTNLGGYVTGITEQQLQNAPAFSDDSYGNRAWEERVHQHYGVMPYYV